MVSYWPLTSVAANGNGVRWFQLYVYKDRDVVAGLVRRAEAAGYTAIALTVDAPFLGRRSVENIPRLLIDVVSF